MSLIQVVRDLYSPLKINEEVDPEETKRVLQLLQVESLNISNPVVLEKIHQVVSYGQEMNSYVHEYDYKNVHANGFRSILAVGMKILQHGIKNYKEIKDQNNNPVYSEFNEEFETMLDNLIVGIHYIKRMRKVSVENSDNERERIHTVPNIDLVIEMGMRYFNCDAKSMKPLLNHFKLLAFTAMGQRLGSSILFSYILSSAPLLDVIKSFFSNKAYLNALDYKIRRLDAAIMKILNAFDVPIMHRFNAFIANGFGPSNRTIYVRRQTEYMIGVDIRNSDFKIIKNNNEGFIWGIEPIRCRYFANDVNEESRNLILHIHGGGACSGSPEFHEVYYQRWSQRLPGVGIISLDYDLCPEVRWPVQAQQVLDVYFWLTKGNIYEVKKMIGFRPKNIVFTGDSSGGHLLFGALLIINDMRKKWPQDNIILPKGLVGSYSMVSMDPRGLSPSAMMTPFHFILMPSMLACAPLFALPTEEKLSTSKVEYKPMLHYLKKFRDRSDPYWMKDEKEIRKMSERFEQICLHPYLSPFAYDDYDSLSGVTLAFSSCHTEPQIDKTIMILRKWKGPTALAVMGDLFHGHLQSVVLGGQMAEAFNWSVDQFKTIFGMELTPHPKWNLPYGLIYILLFITFLFVFNFYWT